ncbi:LytTR family DNA-binding domain-containing protein [Ruminococcaceae bacterium OttesenSCG-928-I18]|nr:LytTR family DNA-binding domain-containing protein [Ruminococcaceae bacterium OttesenSCG-928-I18]
MGSIYRVAVCDDEPLDLEELQRETADILTACGAEYRLSAFASEEELLAALCGTPDAFDLILMDVLLGEGNGVDVARQLRQNGCAATIVFVTCTADFATKGYEVNAYRYILKPLRREELESAILSDWQRSRENMALTFHKGGAVLRILPRDICYVETAGRGVLVYFLSGTTDLPIKISELEQMLPADTLVRCHKSYIVNLAHAGHIDRDSITTTAGAVLPVGRKYYENLRRVLMDYLAR